MQNPDDLQPYEAALQKGLSWILSHRNPDGSFGDTSERRTKYFKVPMALFDNGYKAEAWAHMRWLGEETFTDQGDFEDPRTGYHAAHWPYRNLWYVRAAHFLEMYYLSYGGMAYVLRFRDPATGGIRAVSPFEDDEGDSRQDLILTAFGGLDSITLGYHTIAEAAGEWVVRLLEVQPALDEQLCLMWRPDAGVVRQVPQGHDPRWYVIDRRSTGQDYYNLGVALTFLSHLYRLTENRRYLEGALAYYEFLQSCREDRLQSLSSGKLLYGLTWLCLATGDCEYLKEARLAADHVVETQGNDGYWCQHGGPYLNITAEYVFELRCFIQAQRILASAC
jgi:hypothetical protein